ncbi:MAG: hypothetical protein O7B99_11575, partial [Planctomycetota bacterium]|nr:hypothetical protein [Planctomycetota bacterium]
AERLAEIQRLERQTDGLQEELQGRDERIQEFEREVERTNKRVEARQEELSESVESARRLEDERDRVSSELEAAKAELESRGSLLDSTRVEVESWSERYTRLEAERDELVLETGERMAQLVDEHGRKEEKSRGRIETLERIAAETAAIGTALDQDAKAARADVSRLEAVEADQHARIEGLEMHLQETEEKHCELRTLFDLSREELEELQKEKTQLKHELKSLRSGASEELMRLHSDMEERGKALEVKAGKLADLMQLLDEQEQEQFDRAGTRPEEHQEPRRAAREG